MNKHSFTARAVAWLGQSVDRPASVEMRDARNNIQALFWSYGLAAVVFYAMCSDLVWRINALDRALYGAMLAAAIVATHQGAAATIRWKRYVYMMPATAISLYFIFSINTMFDRPMAEVRRDERRCLAIEKDMLSAHPRRSDSHDLFEAFGCKPHWDGWIYAPPTDREKKAGHPLPWGGYPPSN